MKKFIRTALVMIMGMVIPVTLNSQDAQAILKKLDEVLYAPADQESKIRMVLTDRNGNERIREADVWQKGDNMRLVRFTSPAAEAGIAFLSLPNDVMYVYLPAFGRERRIASHVKNQSFAGTDFTYEDMEAVNYSSKYKPRLLETTGKHHVLELTPLPGVRSDYSRQVSVINREHYYPVSSEYYDRGGNLVKSSQYTYTKKEKYWYPGEIRMTDHRRGHSTSMQFLEIKFDTGLSDDIFTIRNLTR